MTSCPQEVFNVIKKLKNKKARNLDFETVFIKYAIQYFLTFQVIYLIFV